MDAGKAIFITGAARDLQRHLRRFMDEGVISKYAVAEQFVFAASLPKTGVGKVEKKQLCLAYGAAAPT
jgi:fatty-acyl-CoA synthase